MRWALLVSTAILCLVSMREGIGAQTRTHAMPSPTVFQPEDQNAGLEHAQPPSDKFLIERGAQLNREKFKKEFGCYPRTKEYDDLFL